MSNILFLIISAVLIFLTRSHTGLLTHLPDLTLPLLILAGMKFRNNNIALGIILVSVIVDNIAIFYQGVSAHCITPAYSVLLVSYYALYYSAKYLDTGARTLIILPTLVYTQWLIATTSYYAFTTKAWSEFFSYAAQWIWSETYPTLIMGFALIFVLKIKENKTSYA